MIVDAIISALDGGTPYGDTDMAFFGGAPTTYGPVDDPTPSTDSAIATPATTALPDETTVPVRDFAGDFYYRIWAVPLVLEATNPRIGTPIPFHIWNAYPEPNTLTAIGSTGAATLSLDISAPSVFRPIEYRLVNVTILNNDVVEILADYEFTFTEGETPFTFIATVVQFLHFRPDVPVKEVWSWLTDVLTAWDGGEQRISLRGYPRKKLSYSILVADEDERREHFDRWYKSVGFDLVMPTFQYATFAAQPASIGDPKIFLDPVAMDIRDGENIVVLDPHTEEAFFATVATVDIDGLTLDSPLTSEVRTNMIVAPAHRSRVSDRTGIRMRSVHGSVSIEAQVYDYDTRSGLTRPNNLATLPMFDGLPVLGKRPLAENDVPELFERGFDELDNAVGRPEQKTTWPHAFLQGGREYMIHRETDPEDMDYWRVLLDYADGKRNPFLLPTFRKDLTAVSNPLAGSGSLNIIEGRYVTDYFPFNTFKRIEVEMTDGSIVRAVVQTAEVNPDGTATLTLSENFGTVTTIYRISFLLLARLNSDDVELEHDHIDSFIAIQVRAIDA